MVCAQAVLVVAIVDSHLDGDRGIDESDDRGGDTDEVGVSAICRTCKSTDEQLVRLPIPEPCQGYIMGQSALKSSLAVNAFTRRHQ